MEIAFINSGIIAINLLASLKPGEIPGNAALISIFTGKLLAAHICVMIGIHDVEN